MRFRCPFAGALVVAYGSPFTNDSYNLVVGIFLVAQLFVLMAFSPVVLSVSEVAQVNTFIHFSVPYRHASDCPCDIVLHESPVHKFDIRTLPEPAAKGP